MPAPFSYAAWTLSAALNALYTYDDGATDSGVHDESLRAAVRAYLLAMDRREFDRILAVHVRDQFLSDAALDRGYGTEDARSFLQWVDHDLLGD